MTNCMPAGWVHGLGNTQCRLFQREEVLFAAGYRPPDQLAIILISRNRARPDVAYDKFTGRTTVFTVNLRLPKGERPPLTWRCAGVAENCGNFDTPCGGALHRIEFLL